MAKYLQITLKTSDKPQNTPSASRLIYQDKVIERELWHKLVVKVIRWKENNLDDEIVRATEKITKTEWKNYCARMIETNATNGKEKPWLT